MYSICLHFIGTWEYKYLICSTQLFKWLMLSSKVLTISFSELIIHRIVLQSISQWRKLTICPIQKMHWIQLHASSLQRILHACCSRLPNYTLLIEPDLWPKPCPMSNVRISAIQNEYTVTSIWVTSTLKSSLAPLRQSRVTCTVLSRVRLDSLARSKSNQ